MVIFFGKDWHDDFINCLIKGEILGCGRIKRRKIKGIPSRGFFYVFIFGFETEVNTEDLDGDSVQLFLVDH